MESIQLTVIKSGCYGLFSHCLDPCTGKTYQLMLGLILNFSVFASNMQVTMMSTHFHNDYDFKSLSR